MIFDLHFDDFCRDNSSTRDTNVYSKTEIKEMAYIVGLSEYVKLVRYIISLNLIKMDKVQDSMSKIKMTSDNQNRLSRNDRSYKGSCLITLREWETYVKEIQKDCGLNHTLLSLKVVYGENEEIQLCNYCFICFSISIYFVVKNLLNFIINCFSIIL